MWEVIDVSNVGATLRRRRLELGWTMRALEDASGVDDAVISRIENGEIAQPRVDKITRIATALGLDPVVLLSDATGSQPLTIAGFLRSRYPELPADAAADIERYAEAVLADHHINPHHRKEVP
jgi:transcriptional regulator with XRE-family HTH domain